MNNNKVIQWIRSDIRDLAAYHVPQAGDYIKLDAMENPFSWPDSLLDEWLSALRTTPINRYPDPQAQQLTSIIRQDMGVANNIDIVLGNGSDELIQLIITAVTQPGRVVLAPEPTFVMYKLITKLMGMTFQSVPLKDNYDLDEEAMLAAIEKYQPAVVFLAYPNNPTGNLFSDDAIHQILSRSPGLVVIDEAYHAFAKKSYLQQLENYDNLLILRTVSKMGLAGLRLGVLMGDPNWLKEINKVRLPYNINSLTQITASIALQHSDIFKSQTDEICVQRQVLFDALAKMNGIEAYSTQANFILFRLIAGNASGVFESLKSAGILIKNLHGSTPALQDCLRVTVGTASQNQAFLKAMTSIIHR